MLAGFRLVWFDVGTWNLGSISGGAEKKRLVSSHYSFFLYGVLNLCYFPSQSGLFAIHMIDKI
jgi:hypothetical protein